MGITSLECRGATSTDRQPLSEPISITVSTGNSDNIRVGCPHAYLNGDGEVACRASGDESLCIHANPIQAEESRINL